MTAPWTREQIEAWVRLEDPRSQKLKWPSEAYRRGAMAARRAMVRYFPEAPDYDKMKDMLPGVPSRYWHAKASADEIERWVAEQAAALWQRCLSESEDLA